VGGYKAIDKDDRKSRQAAAFAVREQGRKEGSTTAIAIENAREPQTVAVSNTVSAEGCKRTRKRMT